MANRVLMGARSGGAGFFVSKPGVDVVTAAADDLLMSTLLSNLQIVHSGFIASPTTSNAITIPDQGFHPIVLYSCMFGIGTIVFTSNTAITINLPGGSIADDYWPPYGPGPDMDSALYYAVTNIPIE